MKKLSLVAGMLMAATLYCQKDSTRTDPLNIVSLEIGGGSYAIFEYGSPLNLGYQRLFQFKKFNWWVMTARIGIGTDKTGISPPPQVVRTTFFPLDVSSLWGSLSLKGEFGIGMTQVFGRQTFTTRDFQWVELDYYMFYTVRLGVCYIPKTRFRPHFRLAWTPVYVPQKYPIPRDTVQSGWPHHWRATWASITVGFAF